MLGYSFAEDVDRDEVTEEKLTMSQVEISKPRNPLPCSYSNTSGMLLTPALNRPGLRRDLIESGRRVRFEYCDGAGRCVCDFDVDLKPIAWCT